MKDFDVYAIGLCAASVCSSLPPEEIVTRINNEYPTGIDSKWAMSDDPTFRGGEPNPCPCDSGPETHKHYLMEC